jgi:GntR family transcriptional regulator
MDEMWLSIDEKDNRPLYLQIINQIKDQVNRGTIKAGDELPSVRELAESLGINLHTVRSAYLKLRDQGIIDLRLGRRARIARPPDLSENTDTRDGLSRRIKEIITDAQLMGLSDADIRDLVNRHLKQKKEEKI